MHIDVKRLGNTMVISSKGNIDYVTAPELDELISNIADDIESIELDMSDVPYIHSIRRSEGEEREDEESHGDIPSLRGRGPCVAACRGPYGMI